MAVSLKRQLSKMAAGAKMTTSLGGFWDWRPYRRPLVNGLFRFIIKIKLTIFVVNFFSVLLTASMLPFLMYLLPKYLLLQLMYLAIAAAGDFVSLLMYFLPKYLLLQLMYLVFAAAGDFASLLMYLLLQLLPTLTVQLILLCCRCICCFFCSCWWV